MASLCAAVVILAAAQACGALLLALLIRALR